MKLFLKGDRCFKDTCAIEKRNFPPGQHGRDHRPKIVGYGVQLREKQKVRRIYGVLEKQFSNAFLKATKKKGITGETLLINLERRLDSVVARLGFATSRDQARQLVTHGHVMINGRKADIASALVEAGDVITLRERTKKVQQDPTPWRESAGAAEYRHGSSWMPKTSRAPLYLCRSAKTSRCRSTSNSSSSSIRSNAMSSSRLAPTRLMRAGPGRSEHISEDRCHD